MSRISRYVFKEILGPTLLGMAVYGLVLVMNLLLEAAELLIRRDLPLGLVTQYILLSLPRIMVLVIPMAVLLGVLVGIGRLSADSEITALRASGYPDRRLLVPVVALGLLASSISWLLFNQAVPAANYAQHQLNAQIFLTADINREIQPRSFYERIPNMLIYADTASPADGTLRQVLLYQKFPAGDEELSLAGAVSMRQQPADGTIEFHLDQVVSHAWQSGEPDVYQITRSDSQVIERPPDLVMQEMIRSLAAPPPRNLREQTVSELLITLEGVQPRADTSSGRRQIAETLVEVHKKFSLPLTPLVFSILGLPLALGRRRATGRSWGFTMSLLVIIVSYAMLTVGEQLADRGLLSPAVAMWAGNVLFLAIGLAMLATGSRLDFGLRSSPRRTRIAEDLTLEAVEGRQAAVESPRGIQIPPGAGPRQFPSTLDRYLLRHLFGLSALVALSLAVLFTIFYAVQAIDDVSQGGKGVALLVPYLLYLQPQILFSYVVPISLCIGTLVSFALLARTHELTAIRAGGIGLVRVATPFVMASLVMAALSFAANDAVLPYSNQQANQIRDQLRNRSPRSYRIPSRRWVFGTQGLLFNFSDFNPKRQEFQALSVFKFQPGSFNVVERVFAARAVWRDGAWSLEDGWIRTFSGAQERYDPFSTLTFAQIDPPDYFVQDWKAPDQMNYRELRAYVLDLERRGYDSRELRVGLYRKFAVPGVCLVMVLIGLPFAFRIERRGPVFAIAVSILLAFVYYGTLQAFGKLGEVALLPPLLAAWAPNLLFSGIGLYLTATARW